MIDDELRAEFRARFDREARISRAPGRVNLIGEHTDYNDGFVLPVAIELSTRVAFAPLAGSELVVRSTAFEGDEARLALGTREPRRGHWSDYVAGLLRTLEAESVPVPPAGLLLDSDVPLGGGLSSSASLGVSVARALLALAGVSRSREDVARLCQRAENDFVGTQCGIMDPFISCFGRAGHALLLDCRSLETSWVPIPPAIEIVILHSGVRHALADGGYNERRAECEAAVEALRRSDASVRSLRDVDEEKLGSIRAALEDIPYRRARHVVGENARVRAFEAALRRADLDEVGRLLAASHQSLRDDFEVSCAELDLLVDLATRAPGVIGARMTGGGFGGCTVNLVRAGTGPQFASSVVASYARETGRESACWITGAAAGARVD